MADVGCGTGILSFFCAEAGARTVYAIDASGIADYARQIVECNKKSDVIKVIKGKVEEIELPEKVDIIVSEWMGYFLVFESMLDSVIVARDKWLKPDGIMYPATAHMYLCPITDDQYLADKIYWWKNVYGINMTPMIPFAKKSWLDEPAVDPIEPELCLSEPCCFKTFDIKNVDVAHLKGWTEAFKVTTTTWANVCGFVVFFDVDFEGKLGAADPNKVTLSTSPHAGPTHWKQTVLMLPSVMELDAETSMEGTIAVKQNVENPRWVDIEMDFKTDGLPHPTKRNFIFK